MNKNPRILGREFRLSWQEIIIGAALIVLGLVLLIWPGLVPSMVLCGIGIFGIVMGLVHVARYFRLEARASIISNELAIGLTWIAAGVLLIVLKNFLISLLPTIFGLVLLLGGILKLQTTLAFRRMNASHWYVELIGALVSIIFGAIVFWNPFSTAMALMRIIGAALLIEGIQDLVSAYAFKRTKDNYFVEFKD